MVEEENRFYPVGEKTVWGKVKAHPRVSALTVKFSSSHLYTSRCKVMVDTTKKNKKIEP